MNERGVEALVGAALRGVPQITGRLNDGQGGFCALGVLMDALGVEWSDHAHELPSGPSVVPRLRSRAVDETKRVYDISSSEWEQIVSLNNGEDGHAQTDFVGIARKLGPDA